MNSRPKLFLLLLFFFKQDTCSFTTTRQTNPIKIIAQLLSSSTLNISFPTLQLLFSRGSYNTTVFKPIFLVRGFSEVSAARTAAAVAAENKEESGISREITPSMRNFYEWLSGITDGEGCYYIVTNPRSCAFRFQINFHKDDIKVLYYIHKTLGFGEVRSYKNYSSFTVTRLKDIAQLLKIFTQYPHQGSKWLNYRDFSKAFELYINSDGDPKILKDIFKIKKEMNRLRSNFKMPKDKEICITPYWLLGFIEGEGCFSINKRNNFRLDFSLAQSSTNLELLQKIKIYLENLQGTEGNYDGALGISTIISSNPNQQSVTRIETVRIPFITYILIPFLESLTWRTKKWLDFQDWKNILRLKEQGHHLTEQGDKLICLILSQMNNNRLSTTSNQPVDRTLLLDEINQLLSGPSNFELRNGRQWVISLNKYYHSPRNNICVAIQDENGNNIHSFNSILECAKFLDVHPTTITKRIKKSISFLLKNKRVYIKKEEVNN